MGTPPPVAVATVIEGLGLSLAALVLLAALYALPLLKFVGTQAWLRMDFARLTPDDVLANRHREGILKLIRQDSGVTAPQLQRLLGLDWTTIVYHVGVLGKNKKINARISGCVPSPPAERRSWNMLQPSWKRAATTVSRPPYNQDVSANATKNQGPHHS